MNTILLFVLIALMAGAVFWLVRGIIDFLRTSHADLEAGSMNQSGLRQNKAMRMRIAFQAVAVIVVILLLIMNRGS